jgi:membrane protein
MKALFDGLNIAYDEEEKRNFVTKTAWTYAFTFCALLYAVVLAGVLIAAPILFERAHLRRGGDLDPAALADRAGW